MTEQETLTIIKNIEKYLKLKHSVKFTEQMYEFINNPDTRQESDKTYLQLISYYRLTYYIHHECRSNKGAYNKLALFHDWFKSNILEASLNKKELEYFSNNNLALDKERDDEERGKYFKFVNENKIIVDLDYYYYAICERDYFYNAGYYGTPDYEWVDNLRRIPEQLCDLGFWQ